MVMVNSNILTVCYINVGTYLASLGTLPYLLCLAGLYNARKPCVSLDFYVLQMNTLISEASLEPISQDPVHPFFVTVEIPSAGIESSGLIAALAVAVAASAALLVCRLALWVAGGVFLLKAFHMFQCRVHSLALIHHSPTSYKPYSKTTQCRRVGHFRRRSVDH